MATKSELGVIFRLDFPTYQIRALNDDILLVSGGGGGAKTGVLNQIQLLHFSIVPATISKATKLQQSQPSDSALLAESLGCIDTEDNAIMSLDLVSMDKAAFLCTAEGDRCVEYLIDCANSAKTGHSLHEQSPGGSILLESGQEVRKRSVDLSSKTGPGAGSSSPAATAATSVAKEDGGKALSAHERRRRRSESFTCFVEPGLFSCTTLAAIRGSQKRMSTSSSIPQSPLASSTQNGLTCVRYANAGSYLLLAGSCRGDEEASVGRVRVMLRNGCEAARDHCSTNCGQHYKGFIPFLDIDASIPSRGAACDVDRMAVSPDSRFVCTICDSPDNRVARLWHLRRVEEGEQLYASLTIPGQHPVDYRIRHCTFGRIPGRALATGCLLYLTHMPVSLRAKVRSYVSVWLLKNDGGANPPVTAPVHCVTHTLPNNCKPACLAVSEDGRHFALGTLEGQVLIFESRQDALQCVFSSNAHSTFVTDMTFLPGSRAHKANMDWELVTISTDTRLKYFSQPLRPLKRVKWLALFFRITVIFVLLWLVCLLHSVALV